MKTRLFFAVVLTLVSCGKKGGSDSYKEIPLTQTQVNKAMSSQKFECASVDGSPCPEGIARLFMLNLKTPSKSGVCSGSLVAKNKILTNAHCVSTQKRCDETYISVYDGFSYINARCSKVLKTVKEGDIDFSVLELDRSIDTIRPLKIRKSKSKIAYESVSAWVIDHISLTKARITELRCNSSNYWRSTLNLSDCPVIPGNSGSPLINSEGQIMGVVWGTYMVQKRDERTNLEKRRSMNADSLGTAAEEFVSFI